MRKKINELKENELILELGIHNSDEVLGIEKGQIYVQIIHHVDLFDNETFTDLCNQSENDSTYCVDRESKTYETQMIF